MTLAVTTYQWYLMVHILTAVVWVGGGFMIQIFAFRILRANDPHRLAAFAKDAEWIGLRVFAPTSLLLLVFGFLLVSEGDWGWPFWIVFGLVVYALSFAAGIGFFGPESGRIGKLVEARGVADPEVRRRIKRLLLFSRIEVVLLILVIVDMTIKPWDGASG